MPQSKAITNAASHLSVLCESDVLCICSPAPPQHWGLSYRWLSTNIKFFPCVKMYAHRQKQKTPKAEPKWLLLLIQLWLRHRMTFAAQQIHKRMLNGIWAQKKYYRLQREDTHSQKKRGDGDTAITVGETVLFSYIISANCIGTYSFSFSNACSGFRLLLFGHSLPSKVTRTSKKGRAA